MARSRIPLNVFINGRLTGRLTQAASGAIEFAYADDWLNWQSAFSISRSLLLREDRYIGTRVFAVFDNLLPDNDQIRRQLANRVGAAGYDAYSLLAAVGRDCVGAMQFLPEGEAPDPAGEVTGRIVGDREIAAILDDLKHAPLGVSDNDEFRISLAGAQEKTALLHWRGKWRVPHGTTATTHILKPQIGMLRDGIDLSHSVENEHLCMRLTTAFGLPTAATEILRFGDRPVLVVERFDRAHTTNNRLLRLPQEDCCQALSVSPARKYQSQGGPGINAILELLKASEQPEADQRLFLKTQILFWLMSAIDGHAKNSSIFLLPEDRFRLAPLYDVMSAQPNADAGQIQRKSMKLAMAVGKNRHYIIDQIQPRHFVESATRAGVPAKVVQGIFQELAEQADGAIDQATTGLPRGFPKPLVASIVGGLRKRLPLVERAAAGK